MSGGLFALVFGFSHAPRTLVVVGMLNGAAGMLALTRLNLHSSYAADILPALLIMGVGIGFVMSSAMNNATLGVQSSDAGVAWPRSTPASRSAVHSAPLCSRPLLFERGVREVPAGTAPVMAH